MAKEAKVESKDESSKAQDNTVFVGNKPAMSYVLAVVTQFGDGNKKVSIKARGKAISRAVDVAEIVRNRFVKEAKVERIQIGTDEIETEEGNKLNVSTIEIDLAK
jgi:DNA-binding protein